MNDNSYWKKRQELRYLAGEKKINSYYKGLKRSFEQAKNEIQSVINGFYIKYQNLNNIVSYADAQLLLSKIELKDIKEFMELVNEHMGEYDLELENISIKARLTRYEALIKQIDAILQQLYSVEYQYKGEELLKEVYMDSYYRTWYNSDVYFGFHSEFAQVDPKTIEELIMYPFNGANFSTRLWKQKDFMLQQLNESLTTMIIQGKNPKTLSNDFAKKFETREYEAYRLLHTEGSFIMEQGTLAAYKEDGVEKYQILATLDHKTSETCRGEDGEIYDIDDWTTGVNAPPYHIFCRTTTIPYYEDKDTWIDTRAARDPETGRAYKVWADTTYSEWYEKYVKSKEDLPAYEAKVKKWLDEYEKSKLK